MSESQKTFVKLFAEYPLEHPDFTSQLIKAFELAFKGSSELLHTEHILNQFFKSFCQKYPSDIEFCFSEFLHHYPLSDITKKQFFIDVLYGLYFGEIKLSEHLEFVLLRILAVRIDEEILKKIWQTLSIEKKLKLICFAFLDLREGSQRFIQLLEEDVDFRELIVGLKSKYLDINEFYRLVIGEKIEVHKIVTSLNNYAQQQTTEFYKLFGELVDLVQDFPNRIYQELEKVLPIDGSQAFKMSQELQQRLASFHTQNYSLADFTAFVRNFGLEGHIPFLMNREGMCEEKTLVEKLSIVNAVFKNAANLLNIDQKNVVAIISFVFAVIDHLDALKNNPRKYKEGIEKLSFGMATSGKKLSHCSSLTSILKGVKTVENISQNSVLNSLPIFVFDQSEEPLLNQNRDYVTTLNQKFQSSIVLISKNEALELAKVLEIDLLLNTTETGDFGFGGARNCIYLLTPLLKMAWEEGVKALSELNAPDLKKYFKRVLDESLPIFMFDDDLEIPSTNILSDALLMQTKGQAHYLSYSIGRNTKYGIQFIDLNRFFSKPQDNFLSTRWMSYPVGAGMSELITPTFFCLNLPFGAEEGHFKRKDHYNALLLPSIHLAGTRYPCKNIPTHFFIGMENHLKHFIPKAINLDLSSTLLDSLNKCGACALPWNDDNTNCPQKSLKEIFEYIGQENIKREMQMRFWRNVDNYLLRDSSNCTYLESIVFLSKSDIESIISSHVDLQALNEIERASLLEIQEIYQFYKRDAGYVLKYLKFATEALKKPFSKYENWFEGFLREGIDVEKILDAWRHDMQNQHKIQFADYPLLQGLYLIFKSIGAGQFNKIVGDIVNN